MKLCVILGDQLNFDSELFAHIDKKHDYIWMAEVSHESTKVWTHKARITLFLSAMRHFRDQLKKKNYQFIYHQLNKQSPTTFSDQLAQDIKRRQPSELVVIRPGEYSVLKELESIAQKHRIKFTCLEDSHFICQLSEFSEWFDSVKQPRQEFFYRMLRKKTGILMQKDKPVGGSWNYDKQNRESFTKAGPGILPPWPAYKPDAITQQVIKLVTQQFPDHPGQLDEFDWPVTRADALHMLDDFIAHRLSTYGAYQDAMWTDEYFLYHSGLSAALNLKLLNPREVIDKAVAAYQRKQLPIASVEGFVRQILGWREYVHGLYWQLMPDYADNNVLRANYDLPPFYWNGQTDMVCLQQVLQQTLEYGYAHHIQRLMVTGLFALLFGVQPRQVHEWYLAIYVDAVEWVELPNTLGMSQYADDGVLASKPYVATGKYIQRMSNYCEHCQYDPAKKLGDDACPFTTLYWDFLQRHDERFHAHPRTALQWRNLQRLDKKTRQQISAQANEIRTRLSKQ